MNVTSLSPINAAGQPLCRMPGPVSGGFPSPAADYYEPPISLDEHLNIRAAHVYLARVEGDSMRDAGIHDGATLVVDRAIPPRAGHIVVAYVDNQPMVKCLAATAQGWRLDSANAAYRPIGPGDYASMQVFGVVTWCLTQHGH